MKKYDKMLEKNKIESEDKVRIVKEAIRDMQNNNERISVCELVRRTKLSRSFFYSNEQIRDFLKHVSSNQQGDSVINRRKAVFDKAVNVQNKLLEKQYAKIKEENLKLKEENEKLKKALNRKELNFIKEL